MNTMKHIICKTAVLLAVITAVTAVPVKATDFYIAPKNSGFKAYMDYRTITNKQSPQYMLRQASYTDNDGLRRYKGRYCIALGTGFHAPVGTEVDVILDTGTIIPAIVGDIKANIHTDETNMVSGHGNIVEFIVDTDWLDKEAMYHGDISKIQPFEGKVATVIVKDNLQEEIRREVDDL